jgi:hypothetical protein
MGAGGAIIDFVVSKKMSAAHRQPLMRGFLADRQPRSLSSAMGTFEDGMNPVIEGPSRLKRRKVSELPLSWVIAFVSF